MKRVFALLLAILTVLAVFTACAQNDATPKKLYLRVTHADGSAKEFQFTTTADNLADALIEQKLVEERAKKDGVYDVVDGEKADWSDGEAWWCFSKAGVDLTVGLEQQKIADGDRYEAVFKRGM